MVFRPKKMDLTSGNCQDGNIDDTVVVVVVVVVVVNDRNIADDSVVDAYVTPRVVMWMGMKSRVGYGACCGEVMGMAVAVMMIIPNS